ncbi:MAG: intradiol ring-cleavage dioxygenase [Gemmatimonadota bacterium]|nr:intradiol ring-cleavage dioxygenase [Gemmatimonadota bacterium]
MENDDHQIGYMLSRREVLGVIGTTGLMLVTGCRPSRGSTTDTALSAAGLGTGTGSCVARPASIEGPYFVDEKLDRSDIRSDPSTGEIKPGAPLTVTFNVSRLAANACAPVAGLMVDVWQCDHLGVYSDVVDPAFDTKGKRFLRGYQTTDADGIARFTTVYPGWYSGRPAHVHFKIRSASSTGRGFDFTSQLYFDEKITEQIYAQAPYAARGQGDMKNSEDRFYRDSGGQLLLPVEKSGEGYAGTFNIALQGI